MMRLRSLRGRLTAAVTVAFAVWMLASGAGLVVYEGYVASARARSELALMAEMVKGDLAEDLRTGRRSPLQSVDDFFQEQWQELQTERIAMFVVDAGGHVVAQSQRLLPNWPSPEHNGDWWTATVREGQYTVVLAMQWGQTEAALKQQALVLLVLSLCAVVAAAGASWLLVGRTLGPISHISQQATAASTDTLRPQLTPPSEDAELVELVATLNDLLSRLGDAAVARGRFYAAASHELRTPLQALSGHLEVALSRQRPASEYQASLQEASSQARRLTSLVHDLLELNQLDRATRPPPAEQVSIGDLCDRALQHLAPLAEQRGLHVETALEQEGNVLAPPTHAYMMVRNLIDNAVRYASPGGRMRVAMQERPEAVELTVFNTATSVPRLDVETLFEPFSRQAPSPHQTNASNGLGLAICRGIARANDWTLSWEQGEEGVLVTVVFTNPKQV